jgi:hypothetical protein
LLSGFAPSFPLRPFGTPFSRCSSPFAFVRLLFLLFAVLVCPKKCFFSSLSLFSSVLCALDFFFRSASGLTNVHFTHIFFIEVTFATTYTPLPFNSLLFASESPDHKECSYSSCPKQNPPVCVSLPPRTLHLHQPLSRRRLADPICQR